LELDDKYILRDCLETLKHQAMVYQWASFECDDDRLRKLLQHTAIDKNDLRNAVFNLMHQRGMYPTASADMVDLQQLAAQWQKALADMPTGAATQ